MRNFGLAAISIHSMGQIFEAIFRNQEETCFFLSTILAIFSTILPFFSHESNSNNIYLLKLSDGQ